MPLFSSRLAVSGLLGLALASPAAALSVLPRQSSWVACHNGLLCVRAPCPSTNALNLETGEVQTIHRADLSRLSPADQAAALEENALWSGTRVVEGEILTREVSFGGRAEPEVSLVVSALGRAAAEAESAACKAEGSRFPPPS
ncbi:DUF6748 domain-containing protein [Neomegalonema sp.]|uniref:DUF6748 domain-containing protein n=1 Tax=Neomegalonema sp. TaxID=2039713 RepID=UPI00262965D1|nr:DUF6748 domain-containing protein [Neomegalonema sp.]MDD2868184.1 hypothetical protein [Neomegalonema sp.]